MNSHYKNLVTLVSRTISGSVLLIYAGVAVVLIALAIFSLYRVGLLFLPLLDNPAAFGAVLQVIHALFVTIIILELLETVVGYFNTSHIPIKPILIAALTAEVRQVLLFGVEEEPALNMAITLASIVILTAAILFVGKTEKRADGGSVGVQG